MEDLKYVILGAGPSGLSVAHTLLARGERSFVVLEREAEAGGLCRSAMVDGTPLDTGGGHFLDVRRQDALALLFQFMPESEWSRFHRVAKIRLRGTLLDHPLEANLWQLPVEAQADFLESVAQAGSVRGEAMPELFDHWITWKMGGRISEEYMLPYNRKMWRIELNRLGTYWLYKLPNVSFRETLLSCLSRKPAGALPAHGEFFYPKSFGYGEVWRRMGESLGDRLRLNTPVSEFDVQNRTVNRAFRADKIISTIPWPVWQGAAKLPPDIQQAISGLVHTSVDIDYFPETVPGDSHWIYEPDERLSYHRILCRSNFCRGSRGYWTETNAVAASSSAGVRFKNEFSYPVNTVDKPAAVAAIIRWAESVGVLPLGRWGLWEHMNSDIAVSLGIEAANKLLLSGS